MFCYTYGMEQNPLLQAYDDPEQLILILGHDTFYFDESQPLKSWDDMTIDHPRYKQVYRQFEMLTQAHKATGVMIISKMSAEKGNRSKFARNEEDQQDPDRYTGPKSAFECYAIGQKMAQHFGVPFITDPQTPEETAIAAPFLDAIQVPAVQASLNQNVDAAVKGCYDGKENRFSKLLFVKIPPDYSAKRIGLLIERTRDMAVKTQKENGIEPGDPRFQSLPAIFGHRGKVIDPSGEAKFVPGMVADAIRSNGGEIGLDVSHPITRGLTDDLRDAAIIGNLRRGLHHMPKAVFMELQFDDSMVLVDGDRSHNFSTADELIAFVQDIKDRHQALKQAPPEQRDNYGFYISSKQAQPHIALITDTLHGDDHHSFSKQGTTKIPNAGYSTRAYWEMLQVLQKEAGIKVALYTARQLADNPALWDEFPVGPNLIGLCVGNRTASMRDAVKRIGNRGGNVVADQRDGHRQNNPNADVRMTQLLVRQSAGGLIVNHQNHLFDAQDTGKPVLLLEDAILDRPDQKCDLGQGMSNTTSQHLHFLQACSRRHLPAVYKQLVELNGEVGEVLDRTGADSSVTCTIFSNPDANDLGLGGNMDFFNAIKNIRPSDPRFNLIIKPFNTHDYASTSQQLFESQQKGKTRAMHIATYDTTLSCNNSGIGNVRAGHGWLPTYVVGEKPASVELGYTGAGYADNLADVIMGAPRQGIDIKKAAHFMDVRTAENSANDLYRYIETFKIGG